MSRLNKKVRKTVRFTNDQADRIERAAKVLAARVGERVDDSEIIRRGSLQYADEILTPAAAA